MAIHRNYVRVIMLLLAYLMVASWIQINYESTTGMVYIAMGLISLVVYALAESLGLKDTVNRLIGIDDNWHVDGLVGILIGFVIIAIMEVSFVTMGYPAAIYPQTAFAERVTLFSTLLVVGFLAAVGEEIVFRGWAAWGLLEGTRMKIAAAILSSAMFAAFHYGAYGAHLESAYVGAFLIGLMLSWIATWRKSLVPCIIIHSMINVHLFIQSEQLFVIGI